VVDDGRGVPADLDDVDGEVGALERRAALEVGLDRRCGAGLPSGELRDALGGLEPLGVDVVEGDRRPPQLGEAEDVAEQHSGERAAPGADERDPGVAVAHEHGLHGWA
jgi:hypothetical protein